LKRRRRCFTSFDPGLLFSLSLATSLGIPFKSEGFHANTSRFALRRSTSALSYLGSIVVPIRSIQPSSETTASLTSLADSKEQDDVVPLGPDECLHELKAFSVALVCTLIRSPYCGDSLRTGNL
jgi:hypothetical protein